MSSLLGHCHGEKTHFSRNEKRTFSLSQMNNVELARTLSWRENALFEERKRTLFVRLSTIIITKGQGVRDFFQYLCKGQANVNGSVATRRDNA